MSRKAAPIDKRFWSKVDQSAGPDACWPWTGHKQPKGYGAFSIGRKFIGAHRFSYILAHGSIPDGLYICHHCDNPSCVNPSHLFAGTMSDNSIDMYKKGRRIFIGKKGQEHPRAKLTNQDVVNIREEYVPEKVSVYKLAEKYNVSSSAIFAIIKHRSWSHI